MKIDILTTAIALSDQDLLARLGVLAGNEREATVDLSPTSLRWTHAHRVPRRGLRLALYAEFRIKRVMRTSGLCGLSG